MTEPTAVDTGPAPTPLTPFQARTLRPATGADVAYCAAVLSLTALALWCGHRAAASLSPEAAQSVSRTLDQLELPRFLPNALLVRDDGKETRLWELAEGPRTIVTFYAPWCAPCQEEVPVLAGRLGSQATGLLVVVGPDEDRAEVRQKIDNLGFKDLRFHVDARGELAAGGRVTALPTTFLIGPKGGVKERIVGYSAFRLQMMLYKATVGSGDGD